MEVERPSIMLTLRDPAVSPKRPFISVVSPVYRRGISAIADPRLTDT